MAEFTAAALIASLRGATEDVKDRVAVLMEQAARGIEADHRARMPRTAGAGTKPPHLADRVVVQRLHELLYVVRSTSPALHLIELGTRDRQARTWRGKALTTARFTGRAPKAGPIFIPLGIARREAMLREAETLIRDREV